MRLNVSSRHASGQRGVSLIETLVALVIMMIGSLGLAGLLVVSRQAEYESYQRQQALILLQDIIARIEANRRVASCYAITAAASGAPYLGTGFDGDPACSAGSLAQQAQAVADLRAWSSALQGVAETAADGGKLGAMQDARGCIAVDAGGAYVVSVAWQGLTPTSAPSASLTCGANLYGSESRRRVAAISMTFAGLAAP